MSLEVDEPDLSAWRQGDVSFDLRELVIQSTEVEGSDLAFLEAEGVALISQSCDVVRSYAKRPRLQFAALVQVEPADLSSIKKSQRPQFAYIPALAHRNLVADLDAVLTVDKREVARWHREAGCSNDAERRRFAAALARHKDRFAFPDWFSGRDGNGWKLRRRIEKRLGKTTPDAALLQALEEIRVRAHPSWDEVRSLEFLCILSGEPDAGERAQWADALPSLSDHSRSEHCAQCEFRLVTQHEITAAEYLESDRLDLDGMSDE